jgi:hypothetical protein
MRPNLYQCRFLRYDGPWSGRVRKEATKEKTVSPLY